MDTQETNIYIAVLIAGGILGAILIYFIVTVIRQQRKTSQLYREKIEAEIRTLEKERSRIAADLHDELGPMLSAVRLQINALDSPSEEDAEHIRHSEAIIDQTISRIRGISSNLLPVSLLRKGIVLATEEFIETLNKTGSLKIEFHYDKAPAIGNDTAIHLFRIIQEVTHNTLKHAKATLLTLRFRNTDQKLYLITEDNGVGYANKEFPDNKPGLGLYNIQSRVDLLKGEWHTESKLNKGTKYIFEFPL